MHHDIIHGGKADDKVLSDFDPKALAKGKKVEMEHTDDPDIAAEIASDHIQETRDAGGDDDDYYDKLALMEAGVLDEISDSNSERYEEPEQYAASSLHHLVPFVGPRGGHGQRDLDTGEVRYDTDVPQPTAAPDIGDAIGSNIEIRISAGDEHHQRQFHNHYQQGTNLDQVINELRQFIAAKEQPERYAAGQFDESKHPRGQPANPGQFVSAAHATFAPGTTVAMPRPILGMSQNLKFMGRHAGKATVADANHEQGSKAVMPEESLHHFYNDMAGKVDAPLGKDPAVDAVIRGEGEYLGKGDDGIAFGVGNQVVKVSTTVPFIPANPFHRTPQEAMDMLAEDHLNSVLLRKAGVPGIPEQRLVVSGDKAFLIMPRLHIPETFTPEQMNQLQESLDGIHNAGWAVRDDIQAGLDQDGKVWHYDLGKADQVHGQDGQYDKDQDTHNLEKIYDKSGVESPRRDLRKLDRFYQQIEDWGPPHHEDIKEASDAHRNASRMARTGEERHNINARFLQSLQQIGADPTKHMEPMQLKRLAKQGLYTPDAPAATPTNAPQKQPDPTIPLGKDMSLSKAHDNRFVIHHQGHEAGYVNVSQTGKTGQIDDAYLHPSMRGTGLLRDKVYPHIEQHFRDQGATKIRADVVDKQVGDKVWKPLGFKHVKNIGPTQVHEKVLTPPASEPTQEAPSDLRQSAAPEKRVQKTLFRKWRGSRQYQKSLDDGGVLEYSMDIYSN